MEHRRPKGESGAMLVTLVLMVLVLSTAGLVALSSVNTASMGDVSAAFTSRAALLAESGYQVLTSSYKHASQASKNSTLLSLHNQEHTLLDSGGVFTLTVEPYYYATAASQGAGASTLAVRFPGARPADFTVPSSGTVAIWGTDSRYHSHGYSAVTQKDDVYTFGGIAGPGLSEGVAQGKSVVHVLTPAAAQSVSRGAGGTLVLNTDAAKVLPPRFGAFDLDGSATGDTGNVYLYQSRNGSTLRGISVLGDPDKDFTFTVTTASKVYAHPVASLGSTGSFGSGDQAASHTYSRMAVLGHVPGGSSGTGGPPPFTEQGQDKKSFDDNWSPVAGKKPEIKSGRASDNQPAITFKGREVLVGLNLQNIGLQFSPGQRVSYDIQTKVKADFEEGRDEYYIAGISFRLSGDGSHGYGVSFFKAYPDAVIYPGGFDAVLRAAGLKNGIPHVILWVKEDSGQYRLLEYKPLDFSDGIVESISYVVNKQPVTELRLNDWSTLIVSVDERISSAQGQRENHVSAYIASPASYPRGTIVWPDDLSGYFRPVDWHASLQPIIDATITAEDQLSTDPEVGLHVLGDSKNEKENRFDDFSFRVTSGFPGSGGSAPGM
jgi:hypothetical protein